MTLEQRITLLSQKVGNHIRDNVTPRLLPTTGTAGQVATKTAGGTVAFVDPFLKSGGTINGTLNVASGQYQINGLTALYDNGGIWGNLRVVGNMAGFNNDGIYLGYNQSNAPVRLYDGGVNNYLNLVSSTFSSVGINKWIFGGGSDDGTFAQFNGAVKIKSDLTVTGTNGTFSTNSIQSNLYFLNLTRSSVALTTVGNAGFGLSSPLARTHILADGASDTLRFSSNIANSGDWVFNPFISGVSNGGLSFLNKLAGTIPFVISATNDFVGIKTTTPQYPLDVVGTANVSHLRLRTVTYPVIQDLGSDNVYMNTRVIQNIGGVYDGMYIGYGNNGSAMNRIFDGTTSNYIGIGSAAFSSAGITKWLFGNQTDNGTFAQFSGAIHAKAGLNVDGYFSFGNSGTRTETLHDAGEMGGRSGFYETYAPVNFPSGASSWWHLISARHSNTGNNYAMQIAGSFFDQRIYYRKTSHNGAMSWREFVSADTSGNVDITGAINVTKGFNLTGNGGFYNGASKFGMDFYSGNTRFYSSGANTTTKGGFEFHTISSDGSIDVQPLYISPLQRVGVNNTNPNFTLDLNGDINASGSVLLGGSYFAYNDGTYQRIYKRNGVAAFLIGNTETYYDADTAHNFRGSGGTYALRIDTANSIFTSYLTRNLFGSQSDDGTANQFAGAIKAKSDLTVAGISYLSATRFNSYVVMNNNAFTYWKDSAGADRRILGVSSLNNTYFGDVDSVLEGSVFFMSRYDHIFYGNGVEKMRLYQNGNLIIQGSLTSPIRTISGGTATYTINSTDNVVIITTSPGSTFTIDAPTTANKGRELTLTNKSIASQTLSQNYVNLSGSTTNQIPNNQSIRLKYNGSDIHQI
ncbi:hypothetical protein LV89_01847 [Arcicella aurantiaca]|uniref:Uncharacterized protein n=1 Tax=Arcicella aurantiaca TaxID=591202 RepID=A0A316ECD4_9BACT|nr:hypothetical protein [Arcicella aurantiaca]PWK27035.1 hypothetical protein LV89_01847 [Arcicella aurantiaca]